jgi:hypothetical protein
VQERLPVPRPRLPRPVSLTEPDLELLRFLSEHRFALADHAAALLEVTPVTATRRLRKLAAAGYVTEEPVFHGRPAMYLISRTGLAAAGSTLPKPKLDLHTYRHDVGVAWLWLAARHGTFGPLSEILAERTLRSRDLARSRDGTDRLDSEPLGVRLGGTGARGAERLHYPDLLLRTKDGRRVALELELSTKARTKLETILAGYGADPRIAGVVYLVQSPSVARIVQRAARKVGVADLVHLQRVRLTAAREAAPPARAIERSHAAVR